MLDLHLTLSNVFQCPENVPKTSPKEVNTVEVRRRIIEFTEYFASILETVAFVQWHTFKEFVMVISIVRQLLSVFQNFPSASVIENFVFTWFRPGTGRQGNLWITYILITISCLSLCQKHSKGNIKYTQVSEMPTCFFQLYESNFGIKPKYLYQSKVPPDWFSFLGFMHLIRTQNFPKN